MEKLQQTILRAAVHIQFMQITLGGEWILDRLFPWLKSLLLTELVPKSVQVSCQHLRSE